jgi:hypothetical protein
MSDNSGMSQLTLSDIIGGLGTVGQVARRLDVSYSTVCGWKAEGFLPSFRAIQISDEFGVPLGDMKPFIRAPRRSPADAA